MQQRAKNPVFMKRALWTLQISPRETERGPWQTEKYSDWELQVRRT